MVAEGTAIYVHVAGTMLDGRAAAVFRANRGRAAGVRQCSWTRSTDFQARVNGQDVADLDAYRSTSPLFTITFPENNIFGVEPGVAQAVAEEYSFIIAPPPPGEYEIFVFGDIPRKSRSPPRSPSSSKHPR